MASKKQKRLAGEARQREMDAAHEAEIERRKVTARRRAERRYKREAAQERAAQEEKARRVRAATIAKVHQASADS